MVWFQVKKNFAARFALSEKYDQHCNRLQVTVASTLDKLFSQPQIIFYSSLLIAEVWEHARDTSSVAFHVTQ